MKAKPENPAHAPAPHAPKNVFAAKAAAFMLTLSYACSSFSPAQAPSAPARTSRISSEHGKVGVWSFRRFGDFACEFLNTESGASVSIGREMVVVRRPSLSGTELERNFPLGGIGLDSLGAASSGGSLILTFPGPSGKFFEMTVSPGGENPALRTFVRE
ncbi:MAG TPA: hypothetical protein PKJ97_00715 [Candidatus Bilamarchaeaceae archaeon]|nr:hypothetical protein [Candidatus Bilamarchaeaceae archaeon]